MMHLKKILFYLYFCILFLNYCQLMMPSIKGKENNSNKVNTESLLSCM